MAKYTVPTSKGTLFTNPLQEQLSFRVCRSWLLRIMLYTRPEVTTFAFKMARSLKVPSEITWQSAPSKHQTWTTPMSAQLPSWYQTHTMTSSETEQPEAISMDSGSALKRYSQVLLQFPTFALRAISWDLYLTTLFTQVPGMGCEYKICMQESFLAKTSEMILWLTLGLKILPTYLHLIIFWYIGVSMREYSLSILVMWASIVLK